MQEVNNSTVSLYVVKGADGNYFAGFDASKGKANFVSNPVEAKKFTNKHDIKLRPDEQLVEIIVDLAKVETKISDPFRPQRRIQLQRKN